MQNILENIANKQKALATLQDHCMCNEVRDEGSKLIVVWPFPVKGLNGIRVDNTAKGILQALNRCEQAWKDSYPSFIKN